MIVVTHDYSGAPPVAVVRMRGDSHLYEECAGLGQLLLAYGFRNVHELVEALVQVARALTQGAEVTIRLPLPAREPV